MVTKHNGRNRLRRRCNVTDDLSTSLWGTQDRLPEVEYSIVLANLSTRKSHLQSTADVRTRLALLYTLPCPRVEYVTRSSHILFVYVIDSSNPSSPISELSSFFCPNDNRGLVG
ncbi:hypothetical protein Mapa_002765 [Marchantia paleacea]|nr:hypothetical protein Mapa_002765 [Marchantia paleacea]